MKQDEPVDDSPIPLWVAPWKSSGSETVAKEFEEWGIGLGGPSGLAPRWIERRPRIH
jgi:hypothetical protein